MMLWNKSGVRTKLVFKENNQVVAFWRTFRSDSERKIEVVACSEGEEGWYEAIVGNFRLPNQAALNATFPQGKGNLGALGDPEAKGVPAAPSLIAVDKKKRKKPHNSVTIPVQQVASGSSSVASGATAGTKPLAGQKRKDDTAAAGESKKNQLFLGPGAGLPTPMPAVFVETAKAPTPNLLHLLLHRKMRFERKREPRVNLKLRF
ncbi:hypothetical protein Hdeb2414_s0012g00394121 [Helianthus debilis subsp. tardiflorus]